MKLSRVRALWLATMVMDLSCLGAWATLTLNLIDGSNYPLLAMFGTFASASMAASLLRRAAASFAAFLFVHASICVLALAWVLVAQAPLRASIWDLQMLRGALAEQRGVTAWLAMFASIGWTVASVTGGVRHGVRSRSYQETCRRFDRGLGWLLGLLFLKLVLRGQTDVPLTGGPAEALVAPLLVSSLLAIGLARAGSASEVRRVSSEPHVGIALGFSALVCALTLCTALLLLPALQTVSKIGQQALEAAVEPAGRFVVRLLSYLLGSLRAPPPARREPKLVLESPTGPVERQPELGEQKWDPDTLLSWVYALMACVLVVWVLRRAVRSFGFDPVLRVAVTRLCLWCASALRWLQASWARWRAPQRREHEAVRLYRALVQQGRRYGIPRRSSETPLEYGRRLSEELALVIPEIDILVASFNQHVYGRIALPEERLVSARKALWRLRGPRLLMAALTRNRAS